MIDMQTVVVDRCQFGMATDDQHDLVCVKKNTTTEHTEDNRKQKNM